MSWAWNPTRDPQARLICGMGMRNNKRGRRKREEKRRKEKKKKTKKGGGFPLKVQVKAGGSR